MTSTYTPEEIQTAVEKLVKGSIRREVDPLGTRRVDLVYSDIQEAAASVLLLYPTAPFYCLALGAARLRDAVLSEALLLEELLDAVSATGRRVLPIADVSALFSAKAALEELEGAAAGRSKGFRDIARVPSYQRFQASARAFLDGPGENVKSKGEIARTPNEARRAIPELVKYLEVSHGELAKRARQLADGMGDFAALNLPSLVASGVISKARQVLGEHADRLAGLSQEERLLEVKNVTLDVLAAKAVVRQFGSFAGPTEFFPLTGIGKPFADQGHPALPAVMIGAIFDKWVGHIGPDRIKIKIDGLLSGALLVDLGPSRLATVNNNGATVNNSPGWVIGDGSPLGGSEMPNNNELRIQVDSTVYPIPLTLSTGSTDLRSVENIVSDLNLGLPSNVRSSAFFSPLEYAGPLDIDAGAYDGDGYPLPVVMRVPAGASDLVALGVKPGHVVKILTGPNAGVYPVTVVTVMTMTVQPTLIILGAELGALCEVGPAERIRIACTELSQVAGEVKLTVLADTVKSANACTTLGFFPGLFSACRPTTMDELAAQVNGQTDEVTASTLFTTVSVGRATSQTTKSASVVFEVPVTAERFMTVRIEDGPNRGDYLVLGQGALPNEVLLERSLPLSRRGISPVSFLASLGHKYLVLTGKTTGANAELEASGDVTEGLFGAPVVTAYGRTRWFKLPSQVRGLLPGDWLEFYGSKYNRFDELFELVAVDKDLIEVTPPMSLFLAPGRWAFDADRVPPFARLRSGKSYDFELFQRLLVQWLEQKENEASYFSRVHAKINPLLVSETPTGVQVADALTVLTDLGELLSVDMSTGQTGEVDTLEWALGNYVVSPVGAVDTLVKTYKEKGSDRAVDMLLSGLFTSFFGLSADEASHAGALQASMRAVAMNDLAVRRTNRADADVPRQLSQVVSPDYDYDESDIEDGGQVDPEA